MRTCLKTFVLSLALSCVATPAWAATTQHADHATPHPAPATSRAPAKGWATDAPLRKGMRDIATAVDALGRHEQGQMTPEQAAALAGQIQGHVRQIIANCRLPADADAALHQIIAPLMANAASLQADPAKRELVASMRQALVAYKHQFDDPQFSLPSEAPGKAAHR